MTHFQGPSETMNVIMLTSIRTSSGRLAVVLKALSEHCGRHWGRM